MSVTATAGLPFAATADVGVEGLVGTITVRVEDPSGVEVVAETTAGIVETGVGIYTATITAPATLGSYVIIWNDGSGNEASEDLVVGAGAGTPFASTSELAALLGRTFTDAEEVSADLILGLASDAITAAVDKDSVWAGSLVVPTGLKVLCLSIARRLMVNPTGARSQSESLGSYQHAESYSDQAAGGLELTTAERLTARRIVYGSTSASVRVGAIIDDTLVAGHYAALDDTVYDTDTGS